MAESSRPRNQIPGRRDRGWVGRREVRGQCHVGRMARFSKPAPSIPLLPPTSEFLLEPVLKLFRGPATHELLQPFERADVLHSGEFLQSGA